MKQQQLLNAVPIKNQNCLSFKYIKKIQMKKLIYLYLMLSPFVMMTSCTKNFDKINTNPNNILSVSPRQLLPPSLITMLGTTMTRNRNFNNELMQVSVNPSDAEGQVHRYDFRSNWSDYMYNNLYVELTNIKDVYRIARSDSSGYKNESYAAISLVLQSWMYSILTDTYGDLPFTESNRARREYGDIQEPVFDSQKNIYEGIFNMLEEANTSFVKNEPIDADADPIYGGDIAKWRKFANSLYLRVLLRISGKTEVANMCKQKIKEIVENPSKYPIISSNEESAALLWTGKGAYTSPYSTIREQDFRQPGIGSFFIDNLSAWNDPSIDIPTYGRSGINRLAIVPYQGQFSGMESGYAPGSNPIKKAYFYSNTSAYSLQTDPKTGTMLPYSEVQFILAEAALNGWISGSVENYYNAGVESSIKYWVPNWTMPVATYLANADMEWLESESMDEKMQKIHLQKYYALFIVDMQQWFEYRRTGKPLLPKGGGLKNNGVMPARMPYPVYVQSTNPTNYKKAVTAQGADVLSTQVWWQKP